jgi:hypothetical protein
MNAADTKKALLTAQRAYDRATRAKTCALAQTNLRLGQQWGQRGYEGYREHVPAKLEYSRMAPAQRELFELWGSLANAESRAHENRLDRCGITQTQHERAYWEDRARSADAADKSRERQYRKRSKKR